MRIERWITKATNTFRICNTYRFSTATMFKQTHFNVRFVCYVYTYIFSHFIVIYRKELCTRILLFSET